MTSSELGTYNILYSFQSLTAQSFQERFLTKRLVDAPAAGSSVLVFLGMVKTFSSALRFLESLAGSLLSSDLDSDTDESLSLGSI